MLTMDLVLDPKSQKELQEKLSDIPPEIRNAMKRAIMKFAGQVENESTNNTGTGAPAVTGELRSRSFSELIENNSDVDDITAVAGFEKFDKVYGDENPDTKGKYYAIYVHEINKNYHNGSWKFLENALKKMQPEFLPYMKDEYDKAIKEATK